jgi:hypothetical protein
MKGWSQILNQAARDLLSELKRIAPDSPVLTRAETVFEIADGAGIKPSGRKPDGYGYITARRQQTIARIEKRDRDDAEVKRLYESGHSLMSVGERMGHTPAWVTASLARTGTPTRPRGPGAYCPNPERTERIRAMRANGWTLEEIGATENITRERVRQLCHKAGIDTSESHELTAEQKAAVAEYIAGGSLNLVSAKYGVGTSGLRNWVVRSGKIPRRESTRRTGEKTQAAAKRAADLYRAGKSGREIADALGLSKPEMVYRFLAIAGIKPDRQPKSGRHGLRQ